MDETTDVEPRPRRRRVNGTLLRVAGAASAAAGLLHAAAAGSHAGLQPLATIFAVTAVVQVGLSVLTLTDAGRRTAWATVVLNAAFVGAWAISRTVGLPLLEDGVQVVGIQDLLCAVLGGVSVVAAGAAMAPGVRTRRPTPAVGALVAAAIVLLAVPGMAAEHTHGSGGHDDHDLAAGTAAGHDDGHDDGDDHGTGTPAAHNHDHDHDLGDDGTAHASAAGGHDHGAIPARLDHDPSDEQTAAARRLIDETAAATKRYVTIDAAEAAGYRTIGDSRTGVEHFINADYLANATILDPSQPESLVYRVEPDGSRTFVTVMYVMPPGSTMDEVPDVAGNVTVWHQHDNLCFGPTGRISGVFSNGRCLPSGVQGGNVPMLHVWVTPNECGPFAGTDKAGMSGSCVTSF